MATVLPHAGFNQPPPAKAAFPHLGLKVPAAIVPAKAGAHAEGPSAAKPKFQALLDQLSMAIKGGVENAEKAKVKVKTESHVEKPKEAKKTEVKDHKEAKTDSAEAVMALLMPVPKLDPVLKAKTPEGESVQSALDKAKAPVKDRRTGLDVNVPAPVTAASAEIARAQAQSAANAPRTERSEEKQRVFVVDRRSDKDKEKLKLPGAEAAAQQPVNASVELQNQAKAADPKAASTDVQVAFQAVGGKHSEGFDLKPQNTPVPPRDALSFQQYLVDRGYGQMVDQARIVLKDQNAGEIRMTLYPESLGKVKVALNLSDNTLAGQIFVENQTVKDVFQSNMDGLMQAFRDGGWNDLSLQVSVGNGGGGSQAGNGQPQQAPQARDYGRQVAQTVTDGRTDRIGSWNDRQVNLTA